MGLYEKFAECYDLIYKEIVNYEKETDDLEKIFAEFCKKKPKSILDVSCSTGSHSLILSRRGYSVTGIDISERMIEEAKKKTATEECKVEYFVQDMRKLNLNRTFDCAICMFGGFGYILTYTDLVSAFSGLRRHLKKNGIFVFEFWNVGGVRETPYQTWLKVQDKDLTLYRLSESNFDPQTNILAIDFHFIALDKNRKAETFDETHKIRCYTLSEIRQYLEDNGFKLVSAYSWSVKGAEEFEPPKRETFRVIAVAKKN